MYLSRLLMIGLNVSLMSFCFFGHMNLNAQGNKSDFVKFGFENEFSHAGHRIITPLIIGGAIGFSGIIDAGIFMKIAASTQLFVIGSGLFQMTIVGTIDKRMSEKIPRQIHKKLSKYTKDHLYYSQLDGSKLIFPNLDWWVDFTTDQLVLELKSKPKSSLFFKEHQLFIQENIYDAFRGNYYYSRRVFGMGHLNIGGDWLKKPLLIKNFLKDLYNHSELYLGALYYDTHRKYGASPKGLSLKSRRMIKKTLAEIETMNDSLQILKKLKSNHIGVKEFSFFKINLGKTIAESWIELRSVRTQKSAEDSFLYTSLIESRLNYLDSIDKPITYYGAGAISSYQQGLDQFYLYVIQSGLNWDNYKKILPRAWRLFTPSEKVRDLASLADSHLYESEYRDKVFKYNPNNNMPLSMICSMLFLNR